MVFLGYPDGRLVPSIELRRDISRQIRRIRPERLVCQSPERLWDRIGASHPDHLAAGEASVSSVYPDARNPFAHPELLEEGLEPHAVAGDLDDGLAPTPTAPSTSPTPSTARSPPCAGTGARWATGTASATACAPGPRPEAGRPAWPTGAMAEAFQVVVIP